jgi:hypothetical protein
MMELILYSAVPSHQIDNVFLKGFILIIDTTSSRKCVLKSSS